MGVAVSIVVHLVVASTWLYIGSQAGFTGVLVLYELMRRGSPYKEQEGAVDGQTTLDHTPCARSNLRCNPL